MDKHNWTLWVALAALVLGCEPQGKVRQLEQQNAKLEQRITKLEQRIAKLERPDATRTTSPDPLGGLLGQLLKGPHAARRPARGRTQPMDPELQRRLDRLMVNGLEKLAKSDEAKDAVKAVLKMITADMRRQVGSGGGLGDPAAPAAGGAPGPQKAGACMPQERTLARALQRAGRCRADADCTVLRTSVCGREGLHCYAALVHKDHQQAARDAVRTFRSSCAVRARCRCSTPSTARCSAGRCVPGR